MEFEDMTTFDFDSAPDRRGTGSVKWDLDGDADLLQMWVADMDFPVAPPIDAAIRKRVSHPVYGYGMGGRTVAEPVAAWLSARHGWSVDPRWVLYSPGVVPSIAAALFAFTKEGDGVVIQPPVYHPFSRVVAGNGRRLLENPLIEEGGRWRMDLKGLEEVLALGARMLVLCSPHNPVGRVWRKEELDAVVELCAASDAVIVSDEIHADLLAPGARHFPTASVSSAAAERVVALVSSSKTFNIAGISVSSCIVPDPELRHRLAAQFGALGLETPNVVGLAAQTAAYAEGGPWLDALLAYIEGNYRRLSERLAAEAPIFSLAPREGTYLAWMDCRAFAAERGFDPRSLVRFFRERARVRFDEGLKFGTGGEFYMRINLACPRRVVDVAVDRIVESLAS